MPDIKIIILFLSDIKFFIVSSPDFKFIIRILPYIKIIIPNFCRISSLLSTKFIIRILSDIRFFIRVLPDSKFFIRICGSSFYLGRSNSDPLLMLVEYVRNNLSNIQFYFKLTYLDNYRKKHMATVSGNIMLIAYAITGKCQTNISTLSPPNNKDENQTNIVHKFITH